MEVPINSLAELRALKARLAALEGGKRPAEISPETAERMSRQGTVARDGRGNVVKGDADTEDAYNARGKAQRDAAIAERAAYDLKCRAGLPSGLWRDPNSNIVRRANGEAASREEIEGGVPRATLARAHVEELQRAENHSRLESEGLLPGGAGRGSPYSDGASERRNEKE
jgi:hypothetical protein